MKRHPLDLSGAEAGKVGYWRPTPAPLTRAELARLAKPTRWHWWDGGATWATDEHGRPFITHLRSHVELGGQTHGGKVRAELGAPAAVTAHRPRFTGAGRKSYTWDQDPEAGRRFATLRELIDAVLDHHRPDLAEELPPSSSPAAPALLDKITSTDHPNARATPWRAPQGAQEGPDR